MWLLTTWVWIWAIRLRYNRWKPPTATASTSPQNPFLEPDQSPPSTLQRKHDYRADVSFISKPFPCFIRSAHHTARRWAAPGTQGRPEPTGLWSVCGSGSCGTLSAAMWTGRASATRQTQNPSVWNAGVSAGTCSAWLRPCAAPHPVRSGCRSGGSASATSCGGIRERCRYYKHLSKPKKDLFISEKVQTLAQIYCTNLSKCIFKSH